MKKLLFGLSLVGLLAMGSCKKAKDTVNDAANATSEAVSDGANAVGDAANSTMDTASDAASNVAQEVANLGVTMPDFKTPEGKDWADNLVEAATAVKDAATSGDAAGLNAAQTMFTDIATKQITKLQGTEDFSTATSFAQEMVQKVSSF